MTQTSLSYYEKVLKSKVARVRLYPAQDAGAFGCQGAEDRNLLRLHRSCGPAAEKFTIGVVFMNILFFLSPKQDLMYVYDDFTLRQTLEKWENNHDLYLCEINGGNLRNAIPREAYAICAVPEDAKHDVRDRKSTRLNSSHTTVSRMPSSA